MKPLIMAMVLTLLSVFRDRGLGGGDGVTQAKVIQIIVGLPAGSQRTRSRGCSRTRLAGVWGRQVVIDNVTRCGRQHRHRTGHQSSA
jgi:hypothetical protein